jgi:hypothetical protein
MKSYLKKTRSAFVFLMLLVGCVCGMQTLAFAGTPAVNRATMLSKEAMSEYDDFELESAEAKIREAVEILEKDHVTDPFVAKVYVAQGVITYGRFKDSALTVAEDRAYAAFLKAVSLDKDIEIPNDYRSTELDEILDRARNDLSSGDSSAIVVPGVAAAQPALAHQPIATSQRCMPVTFSTKVTNKDDIDFISLYYQTDQETTFTKVDMVPDPNDPDTYTAAVPGYKTRGAQLRYYIEATNQDKGQVGTVGTLYRPYTTILTGECAGLSSADLVELYGDPLFQLSVMIGTGVGIAREGVFMERNKSANVSTTGGAWSPVFIRGSAMFNLPYNMQLGLAVRGQVVDLLTNTDRSVEEKKMNKVRASLMAGLAFRYLAIARQPYRLYIGFEAGWGGANAQVKNDQNKTDIILLDGPWYVAPQIGFLWTFHKNVGLAIELTVPILFPNKPTAVFDIALGPYFQF